MDISDLVYFGVFCFVFLLAACSVFICISAIIDDLRNRVARWRNLSNPTDLAVDSVPALPSESSETTSATISISEDADSSLSTAPSTTSLLGSD